MRVASEVRMDSPGRLLFSPETLPSVKELVKKITPNQSLTDEVDDS